MRRKGVGERSEVIKQDTPRAYIYIWNTSEEDIQILLSPKMEAEMVDPIKDYYERHEEELNDVANTPVYRLYEMMIDIASILREYCEDK